MLLMINLNMKIKKNLFNSSCKKHEMNRIQSKDNYIGS